jgi:quercetin dioxygenase-like cupin family protein
MHMATMQKKNFSAPEGTRKHHKMKAEVVTVGGNEVLKVTFEPGWNWDEHLKPGAGTSSCDVSHLNYVLSGRMHLKMDDGTAFDVSAGDVVSLPSGHTAWVVGDEPVVWLDFMGGKTFAK